MANDKLNKNPNSVTILAMGRSCNEFQAKLQGIHRRKWTDEVWVINSAAFVYRDYDRVFVLDDIRHLKKVCGTVYYEHMCEIAQEVPYITSTVHPELGEKAYEYPYLEIADMFKSDLVFQNTVPMALAYAMYLGVENVECYGTDFMYPEIEARETGGNAMAYVLGHHKMFKCNVQFPATTNFMDMNKRRRYEDGRTEQLLYGFAEEITIGDLRRRKEENEREQRVQSKQGASLRKGSGTKRRAGSGSSEGDSLH